jgi:hypothetical protein
VLYHPDFSEYNNTFFTCFLVRKNGKWGIVANNNKLDFNKFVLEPDYSSLRVNLENAPTGSWWLRKKTACLALTARWFGWGGPQGFATRACL